MENQNTLPIRNIQAIFMHFAEGSDFCEWHSRCREQERNKTMPIKIAIALLLRKTSKGHFGKMIFSSALKMKLTRHGRNFSLQLSACIVTCGDIYRLYSGRGAARACFIAIVIMPLLGRK